MPEEYNHNDLDVARELGAINNSIKALTEKISVQNGRVSKLESKDRKLEILFARLGGVTIAIGFIVATVFNFAVDIFKGIVNKFFS